MPRKLIIISVYFLRKKNKPNKSYITCRYNIPAEETIEYRRKNNINVYMYKV